MNPNLNRLHTYPFEKLRHLKSDVQAPEHLSHIALSIGEPKHDAPMCAIEALQQNLSSVTKYPMTFGLEELRQAIAQWLIQRFQLHPNSLTASENIIPVNGTREAIFAFVQATVDINLGKAKVLMPNPFYQIYEGATILAGATPYFISATQTTQHLPDFSSVTETTWKQCSLLFICTPGNPSGAILSLDQLGELIELADKYDFIIASDECYSELYHDESHPPPGLLQACAAFGHTNYSRCVVFHSLSKRSNLPGLRSGFIAGDKKIIRAFLRYRTYHGCAMPLFCQAASIAAWTDETHVVENRLYYRKKFTTVIDILKDSLTIEQPDAGFYLWPQTPISDTEFTRRLYEQENVTVLPGSFLARDTNDGNPGENRVRIALVASLDECSEAAHRIKRFTENL